MLEVHLLGRGGMVPLPGRYLTALLVRYNGLSILVDCGEGTQMALREKGLSPRQIGVICLTHLHADHVAGLPGLLLTMGNAGRTEPLVIVGPAHVGEVVRCLCVIASGLPFSVQTAQIEEGGPVLAVDDLTIHAHGVDHWVPCFAYKFLLARKGRFDPEKAAALGVPKGEWKRLQGGEGVAVEGKEISPSQVLGPQRKGLGLCYATDLRPSDTLADFAAGVDLFVCEGEYGDPAETEKAVRHRHCHFTEAADMAKKGAVGELWLTHFSPSMPDPEKHLHVAAAIFPPVYLDRDHAVLRFPKDA